MSCRRSAVLSAVACLSACSGSEVNLSERENALAAAAGMPESVLVAAKARGQNLRRMEGYDEKGQATQLEGVSIDVEAKRAVGITLELREQLGSEYLVFVSERNFGYGPDRLSIMKGTDPYDMLRAMRTNGWNYDISPDSVIARVKDWDARFGLDIYGVGFDWLEAKFERQPLDMLAFAREVYAFAPDVVDQGTETIEVLAEEMERTNSLYLWWD